MTSPHGRRIGIAALIWAFSIFLSRIIGLVRDASIGHILGGDEEASVYFAAFAVPDFLNYLLAGGALSIVFIPIFAGYLSEGKEEQGWDAFSVIANLLLVLLAAGVTLLWFALPWLAPIAVPGFSPEVTAEWVAISRIVLPAQIFHVIGGLLSATLQARDRHALPALAPLVYNGAIVTGGLLAGPVIGPYGFAWGVLAGSILGPFGLPLVGCLKTGIRWRPILDPRHPDLRTYLWRSLPIMLGWSVVVVDDWILIREGSLVSDRAVASLKFAKQLMRVPMGVFGLATGVAAYPTLSRLLAEDKRTEAYQLLAGAVRRMLVLAFGAQVALTVAGREISMVIYGDKIPLEQHAAIGIALGVFSLGLWAWAAQTVVARGFYALGRTWLPTLVGTGLLVLYPLYVVGRGVAGTTGLAAATTVAITLYVLVLMLLQRRIFGGVGDGYGPFFARVVPAVLAGIAGGLALGTVLPLEQPLLRGVVLGTAGLGLYAATAWVLRVEELREVARMADRRLRRR